MDNILRTDRSPLFLFKFPFGSLWSFALVSTEDKFQRKNIYDSCHKSYLQMASFRLCQSQVNYSFRFIHARGSTQYIRFQMQPTLCFEMRCFLSVHKAVVNLVIRDNNSSNTYCVPSTSLALKSLCRFCILLNLCNVGEL